MKTSSSKTLKRISNFFTVMYYLFIGLLAISVIVNIIKAITGNFMTRSFPLLFRLNNPGLTLHANGLEIIPKSISGSIIISLQEVPILLSVISLVIIILVGILYIFIIQEIRKIISTINKNQVFSEINAMRLKMIGYFLLIITLISITKLLVFSLYYHSFEITNLSYMLGTITGDSMGNIIAIVFTFFIAAIFKIGASLQKENESFV